MKDLEAVARYLGGELDAEAEATFERHLFDEPELAQAAAWLLHVGDALVAHAAAGPLVPVLTSAELDAIEAAGTRVLHCRSENGSLHATIPSDVELVIARLELDLHDVERVDVAFVSPAGVAYWMVHEAPIARDRREVIVACSAHVALATGDLRIRVTDLDGRVRGDFLLTSTRA